MWSAYELAQTPPAPQPYDPAMTAPAADAPARDTTEPPGRLSARLRPVPAEETAGQPSDATAAIAWHEQPAILAVATGLLLFASFHPLDLGFLAWLALVPLLRLATLPNVQRPYRWALLAGLVWTVPQLQWMRLGDPLMYAGWAALAVYIACYLPALVWLVRRGLSLSLPLPLVAGVSWTALELVRAHLFTGFAWYLLGHSQHRFDTLVQIADLGGAYAISLLVASFAGLLADALAGRSSRLGLAVWATLFVVSIGYGWWQLDRSDFTAGPRVALVQGNFPSSLKSDPSEYEASYNLHRKLTARAIEEQPDLILWPETMLPYPLYEADADLSLARRGELAPRYDPTSWNRPETPAALRDLAASADADLLLGSTVVRLTADGIKRFNTALPITPDGVGTWYAKRHRVPFGEYLPLTDFLPPLARFAESTGLPTLAAGRQTEAIELAGLKVLPLICFEDTVPHLVRSAAREAAAKSGHVDVIANLTNDGWFHGSSELDQHLVTAQFRSIELRLPTVRAVNTGISAVIDGNGRVRQPETLIDLDGEAAGRPRTGMKDATGTYHRQFSGVLLAAIPLDARSSLYLLLGDWLAGGCLLMTLLALAVCWRRRSSAETTPAVA